MSFIIETRRNDLHEWQVYGEFASEAEFQRELPNIQALGLYTRRTPLPMPSCFGSRTARETRRERMIDMLSDQIENRYRNGLVADDLEMAMAELIDEAKHA